MFVIFLPVSAKNMPSIIAFMMETKFPEKKTRKKPVSEKEQLKQLQSRLEYLEEQFEFLKKISSIRNTRK